MIIQFFDEMNKIFDSVDFGFETNSFIENLRTDRKLEGILYGMNLSASNSPSEGLYKITAHGGMTTEIVDRVINYIKTNYGITESKTPQPVPFGTISLETVKPGVYRLVSEHGNLLFDLEKMSPEEAAIKLTEVAGNIVKSIETISNLMAEFYGEQGYKKAPETDTDFRVDETDEDMNFDSSSPERILIMGISGTDKRNGFMSIRIKENLIKDYSNTNTEFFNNLNNFIKKANIGYFRNTNFKTFNGENINLVVFQSNFELANAVMDATDYIRSTLSEYMNQNEFHVSYLSGTEYKQLPEEEIVYLEGTEN